MIKSIADPKDKFCNSCRDADPTGVAEYQIGKDGQLVSISLCQECQKDLMVAILMMRTGGTEMVMPGETIHQGAPNICSDCGKKLEFEVMRSPAGWYVGTWCPCSGPYSRETDYASTEYEAQQWLKEINDPDQICKALR